MVDAAIKILGVVGGLVAGVASYPYINQYVFALVAFFGAVAVGILAGAVIMWLLTLVFAEFNTTRR